MDAPDASGVRCFGDFRLDRSAGGLFRIVPGHAPVLVPLGSRALDVLGVLVERAGKVVAKPDIMASVWAATMVEDANLAVQISALRRALGRRGPEPDWIQTVPGRGYRFVGRVTVGAGEAPPPRRSRRGGSWRVGRARELASLDGLLARAIAGERSVVFITGEAGIGKTSLVEMAIRQVASDQVCMLRGGCTELLGAGEAFLPLIEALQAGIAGPHCPSLIRTLRQQAPTWLAQMPAVLDPAERAPGEAEAFGVSRDRMLREFCDFLEALSREVPCILVLEDCHWSDVATLDALSHLSRRDSDVRLLVMATYRPDEGALDVLPVFDLNRDLRIRGRCVDLALDRLAHSDIERYLALRFADPGLAATLATPVFQRSGGHPLFVTALIDDLVGRGTLRQADGAWVLQGTLHGLLGEVPGHVRDMLTRQIGRLSLQEQHLLEVASADDGAFCAASVAGAADADLVAVEQCLDALARKGLVLFAAGEAEWPDGTRSGRYGFQHAMYREVLYQRLGPGRRAQTHRRLGEGLERGYRHQTADIAAVLALHFEQSRDAAKAIRYLDLAADKAARRFAGGDAARYLTRALAMVDLLPGEAGAVTRLNLLRRRGWARRSGGDLAGSLDDFRAVTALAAAAGEVRLEAAGLMDLSRFSMFADRRQCLANAAAAAALAGSIAGSPADAALASLIRAAAPASSCGSGRGATTRPRCAARRSA